MTEVSLTEFVDFVIKSGSPKLTVVRNVKKRREEGYDPKVDYYKKLRDGIVGMHKNGLPKSALDRIVTDIPDGNKQNTYPALVGAYQKFIGRKTIDWFAPPRVKWCTPELTVLVNPELGLVINGSPYCVKLYFKSDPLSKAKATTILHLMGVALPQPGRQALRAILDVRNGKLIRGDRVDPLMTPLLIGEAASFASIYGSI